MHTHLERELRDYEGHLQVGEWSMPWSDTLCTQNNTRDGAPVSD